MTVTLDLDLLVDHLEELTLHFVEVDFEIDFCSEDESGLFDLFEDFERFVKIIEC